MDVEEDGSLSGFIGGYQHWKSIYNSFAAQNVEGMDAVGVYYAMQRFLVPSPDGRSTEKDHISSAYSVEALPAFLFDTEGRLIAGDK